jgi:hypothetical protein
MYDDLYIVYNRYTYVHEAKRREQQFKRTDFSIEAVNGNLIRRENLLALSLITPLQQSNSKVYFW